MIQRCSGVVVAPWQLHWSFWSLVHSMESSIHMTSHCTSGSLRRFGIKEERTKDGPQQEPRLRQGILARLNSL